MGKEEEQRGIVLVRETRKAVNEEQGRGGGSRAYRRCFRVRHERDRQTLKERELKAKGR